MWLRAPPEEPSSDRFTTMQALYKNEMKNLPKSRRIIFLDCTSDPALNFQNEPDLISKLLIFSLGSRQPVVVAVEELLKSKLANNPERLWLPEDHPLYHSPPPLHITGLGVDSHMDAAAEGRSRSDITVDLSNVSFTQSPGYSYRPTTHQSSTEGMVKAKFAVASIEVKMPQVFTKNLPSPWLSEKIPAPADAKEGRDLIAYQVIIPLEILAALIKRSPHRYGQNCIKQSVGTLW